MDGAELALARSGSRRALVTISAILFLTFLDTTIMSVALADVQSSLHAGVSSLQWVVNGYALVFASLMLGFGTLGDRIGRKRVMLAGVAVFVAGSVFGAMAPNTDTLIAARAIMGVGAAACEPGTLSIIRHLYPERAARARALGVWAAIAGLALAMGPVIGGVLVGLGGWRAIFWFNLGAGVVAFAAARTTVPESADPQSARFDVAGFLLGPAALGTVVFAVILGEAAGYAAGHIIALFAIAAAAMALFVFVERRSKAPMLDVAYLRKPAFSGSMAVAFAAYFGIFSIFFLSALYLQVVIGYSAYRTAALFVPMAIAMIVASAFAGRWVARVGPRLPVAVGCLAAGVGMLLTDLSLSNPVTFTPLALVAHARRAGLRHRRRAGHLGGPVGGAAGTLRHGGLGDHHEPRGRVGGRRGRARIAVQRQTHDRPHRSGSRIWACRPRFAASSSTPSRPGRCQPAARARPAPSRRTAPSWPRSSARPTAPFTPD